MSIATTAGTLQKPMSHTDAFRRRRGINWITLGMTYATMYMARYNFSMVASKITQTYGWNKTQLVWIISTATLVYGVSAIINGPLGDKWGGRKSMLIGAVGAVVFNVL